MLTVHWIGWRCGVGSTAWSSSGSGATHAEEAVAGVGVGEGEVDGAPDSKAKPLRRLAEAEWRQKSVSTAAQGHGAAE